MGTHAAKNRHSSTTSQRQEPSIIAGKKSMASNQTQRVIMADWGRECKSLHNGPTWCHCLKRRPVNSVNSLKNLSIVGKGPNSSTLCDRIFLASWREGSGGARGFTNMVVPGIGDYRCFGFGSIWRIVVFQEGIFFRRENVGPEVPKHVLKLSF